MKIAILATTALAALTLAACGDNRTDDVVQVPADGARPVEVTQAQADAATDQAAVALGMTRQQLEDADLKTTTGTDLGDVETLVMDAVGTVTHVVVELEGQNELKVQIPLAQVRAAADANGRLEDLTTDLSADQLAALPRWTATGASPNPVSATGSTTPATAQ